MVDVKHTSFHIKLHFKSTEELNVKNEIAKEK